MKIYNLSGGGGNQERIVLEGLNLEVRDRFHFLNPDEDPKVSADARFAAAKLWPGFQLHAKRGQDKRAKPYFQDAMGPGFALDGCSVAVSEHAREVLTPYLQDQIAFLELDIVGAPCRYWGFYATQYYGELDEELSVFSPPYSSAADRRKMLRHAAFRTTDRLNQLYVFRVPGTFEYVPPNITYATQRFVDLLVEKKLGGFNFLNISHKAAKFDPSAPPVLVTEGTKYRPNW